MIVFRSRADAMTDMAPAVDADGAKDKVCCFVVDEEPAVGRFIGLALGGKAAVEQFANIQTLLLRLSDARADVLFLNISLGDEDAVEALRQLAARRFSGGIVLMSGWSTLLNDIRRIGLRRGLHMLPSLEKPFRVDAIHRAIDALSADRRTPAASGPQKPAPTQIDLGEALDHGWVELWYQPKVHLRERRLIGAEGLARIRHPELGLLRPESFASASDAEIIRLGEMGLRAAVRDAAEFIAMGRNLRLAVNLPVAALLTLPIVEIVREERRRGGAWNGMLLEITEEQIVQDIDLAHEVATQLRIHDIVLTIDDFGTGYSSLARLAKLPFAELKLARDLVDGCSADPTRYELCRMATELGHRLGCQTVAEGIETTADLAAIREIGTDIGQGYLFAHPMPKEFLVTRLIGQAPDGGFANIIDLADGGERAIA
jgi:EAL domain-containing protein (putative c-di-GMP-specific phosphodiesterase class I)/CheY-like chemotaxis protein